MFYQSKQLGTATGIGPEGEPVRVQVQTGFIEERINGRSVFLATVNASPSNALDHEPPKLFRGPFGDTPEANLQAAVYQAGLYQAPVSSFVMSEAHKAMTDPETQLIDTYGQVNRAVRRDLMTTKNGFDQIAFSLGCLTLAEDIDSRGGADGDIMAALPIGGAAYSTLGPDKLDRLSRIPALRERIRQSLQEDGAEKNKWRLIAKLGIRNAFAEGMTMLMEQRDLRSWREATRGFGGELLANLRRVDDSLGRLVIMRAFAIGANAHIGPELETARQSGRRVTVITGEKDKVYRSDDLRRTLQVGKQIDELVVIPDVRHPYPVSKDGKRILRAGARAHYGQQQEYGTTVYASGQFRPVIR